MADNLLPPDDPSEALDADGNPISFDTMEEAMVWVEKMRSEWAAAAERAAWLRERGLPPGTTDERIAEIETEEMSADDPTADLDGRFKLINGRYVLVKPVADWNPDQPREPAGPEGGESLEMKRKTNDAEQPREDEPEKVEVVHFTPRQAPPVDEEDWRDALRKR